MEWNILYYHIYFKADEMEYALKACPCKNCTEDWEGYAVDETCHEACYWFKQWASLVNR